MIKKEMNHMTTKYLARDIKRDPSCQLTAKDFDYWGGTDQIVTAFNAAVDDDENLTEDGKMNWDWVSADVWIDLAADHPDILARPVERETEMTFEEREFIDEMIDHLAAAWEEARWDRILDSTEPMESFPW